MDLKRLLFAISILLFVVLWVFIYWGGSLTKTIFLRIGTAEIGGTYYPLGGIFSYSISDPVGSNSVKSGTGVKGLVALSRESGGSIDNINDLQSGKIDLGIIQSDLAYWAYTGTGIFSEKRIEKLRAVANLYPEKLHIIVKSNSNIDNPSDFKGKNISISGLGSGTYVHANILLSAYGLSDKNLNVFNLKIKEALERFLKGDIDVILLVTGRVAEFIENLFINKQAKLIGINKRYINKIVSNNKFFESSKIYSETYSGITQNIDTLAVHAQLFATSDLSDVLVYKILKSLWNKNSQKMLKSEHPIGKEVNLENALNNIDVPLHDGAKRFYKEVGMIE